MAPTVKLPSMSSFATIPSLPPSLANNLPRWDAIPYPYISYPLLFLLTTTTTHHLISYVSNRRGPKQGKLIAVSLKDGATKLRVVEEGGVAGNGPIVIFVSGMGTSGASFGPVQRKLEERAPGLATVVYDRAGLGWSQPAKSTGPRDLSALADELHALLTSGELHAVSRASKPPVLRPVILVGHSYGGPIVETYRQNHPSSHIHSIILVDPSPTALFCTLPSLCKAIHKMRKTIPYFSFLGLTRLLVPTLMSRGMFSPKTRYGAALTPAEKASLYRDMIETPNTIASANESDMLAGCQFVQMQKAALQTSGKYVTVPHCIVIHGSESKFPKKMSGIEEDEFERRAREERFETGLALSGKKKGEWNGFWIDEGADHMDTVVGDLVVDAVLDAVKSVKA